VAGGVALLGCEGTWRDAHVFHADLRRAEELLLIDARARAAGIGSASRSRPSILLNQAYHSRRGHWDTQEWQTLKIGFRNTMKR
jgi:hypothetical protein